MRAGKKTFWLGLKNMILSRKCVDARRNLFVRSALENATRGQCYLFVFLVLTPYYFVPSGRSVFMGILVQVLCTPRIV